MRLGNQVVLKQNDNKKSPLKLAITVGKFKKMYEHVSSKKSTGDEYAIVYNYGYNLVKTYKDIMNLEDELESYLRALEMGEFYADDKNV